MTITKMPHLGKQCECIRWDSVEKGIRPDYHNYYVIGELQFSSGETDYLEIRIQTCKRCQAFLGVQHVLRPKTHNEDRRGFLFKIPPSSPSQSSATPPLPPEAQTAIEQ
jgi:hypothetical protein